MIGKVSKINRIIKNLQILVRDIGIVCCKYVVDMKFKAIVIYENLTYVAVFLAKFGIFAKHF